MGFRAGEEEAGEEVEEGLEDLAEAEEGDRCFRVGSGGEERVFLMDLWVVVVAAGDSGVDEEGIGIGGENCVMCEPLTHKDLLSPFRNMMESEKCCGDCFMG